MVPAGLRLVSFTSPRDWDKTVSISYCDYSGHRAHRGGCHYTATYELKVTPAELFKLLEPHFTKGPGNQPDRGQCEDCGEEFFGDELHMDFNEPKITVRCDKCLEVYQGRLL